MDRTVLDQLREAAPRAFGESPVAFAYLFGSWAVGLERPDSDADVAVYLHRAPGEPVVAGLELSRRLSDASGVPNVQVLVLNGAPLPLRGRVVRDRITLYSRDEPARVRYESITLREFFDYQIHAGPLDERFLKDIAAGRR
jgi:uncharacterized protein